MHVFDSLDGAACGNSDLTCGVVITFNWVNGFSTSYGRFLDCLVVVAMQVSDMAETVDCFG